MTAYILAKLPRRPRSARYAMVMHAAKAGHEQGRYQPQPSHPSTPLRHSMPFVPKFGRTFASDSLHWLAMEGTVRGHRTLAGLPLAKSAYLPKADQGHLGRLPNRRD